MSPHQMLLALTVIICMSVQATELQSVHNISSNDEAFRVRSTHESPKSSSKDQLSLSKDQASMSKDQLSLSKDQASMSQDQPSLSKDQPSLSKESDTGEKKSKDNLNISVSDKANILPSKLDVRTDLTAASEVDILEEHFSSNHTAEDVQISHYSKTFNNNTLQVHYKNKTTSTFYNKHSNIPEFIMKLITLLSASTQFSQDINPDFYSHLYEIFRPVDTIKKVTGELISSTSEMSCRSYISDSIDLERRESFVGGNIHQICSCENDKCNCSCNNLKTVPQELPKNVKELKIAFNNIMSLPRDVFARYGSLNSLDLSYNKIRLQNGSFNGLSSLRTLDISYNYIEQFPVHVFQPLKSLKVLRMHGNKALLSSLYKYPDVALSALTSLEELHLDGAPEINCGPGFRNLTSLRKLFLSSGQCNTSILRNDTFKNLDQITHLNLSFCSLNGTSVETGAFSPLKNLLVLDLSQNQRLGFENLGRLMWGLANSSLHTLIIDSIVWMFSLHRINGTTFQYVPQTLRILIARRNSIVIAEADLISKLPKGLKILDMRDTVVSSDIRDTNVSDLPALETVLFNSQECFEDDFNIYNLSVSDTISSTQSELDIRNESLNGHILQTLKRVGVNAETMITSNFLHQSLYFFPNNNIETLNICCDYMTKFPFYFLPFFPKLRNVTIRGTSISELIISTYNLSIKVLKLRSQRLDTYLKVTPAPFSFLPNLTYLDLSLNQLSSLREDLFQGLDHLEYLRLDRNVFSNFQVDVSNMVNLKYLNLSSTAIGNLPAKTRSIIGHLNALKSGQIRIDMADCPIQCDCYNLNFLKWMVNSKVFDPHFKGYKCKYLDTSQKYVTNGYNDTIKILQRECAENYPLFLIAIGATVVLVFSMMGSVLYRLRWKLRYLYYAAYLKFMDKHKPALDKQFEYDVFLCYDSEDNVFIIRELSRELENRGLTLLIHSRDFVAGDYIASNIVKAVTASKKTLVLVTRNLLKSSWCNYEIQIATMESVYTGRQVLVFLLKENIPNKDLGVELLRYIRSNTYLPYPTLEEEDDDGDDVKKRFYDKLTHDLKR